MSVTLGMWDVGCGMWDTFMYGKTKEKEKVYITAGPEFGSTLCRRKSIINKSLYGLKTSRHVSPSTL